jgi:hypothetical protein
MPWTRSVGHPKIQPKLNRIFRNSSEILGSVRHDNLRLAACPEGRISNHQNYLGLYPVTAIRRI